MVQPSLMNTDVLQQDETTFWNQQFVLQFQNNEKKLQKCVVGN